MLRRFGIFALLAFQALWLNVILPGHTRGIIALPSAERTEQSDEHACCEADAKPASDPAKDKSTPQPTNPSRCAVCYFAATLSTPAELISLPAMGLLASAEFLPVEESFSIEHLAVYLERGPPIS